MALDIEKICRRIGLREYQLAALLGEAHTTLVRLKKGREHRPVTLSLYWILAQVPEAVIPALLDRWLYEKPKNEDQARELLRIAEIFLSPQLARTWQKTFRSLYHGVYFF